MTLGCVVVGVDGSEASDRAAEFALRLVEGTGARLVAAAAYLERPELPAADNRVFRDEAEAVASTVAERAAGRGIECTVAVHEGDPRAALDEIAEEESADLLVVGTRGRGPLARAVLGSVASYLTSHASTPVAVVR